MIDIEMRYYGGPFDGGVETRNFDSLDCIFTTIDIYPDTQILNNKLKKSDGRYTLDEIREGSIAIYQFQYPKKEVKHGQKA
jgi:hypothetical protein